MNDQDRKNEALPFRAHLLLRPEHHSVLAWIWVFCILGMGFYFGVMYFSDDGLADIDNQAEQTFEFKVDLNSAPWPEFANLPGIGEVLAHSIVRHRESHGPFENLEQLMDVPLIGEAKFRMIEPLLLLETGDSQSAADESANLE